MTNIRVATAALSGRIFAGRPTKDGLGFKEPRYDVTGDVFKAVRDKIGIGKVVDVALPGSPVEFRIAVLAPDTPDAVEAAFRAGHRAGYDAADSTSRSQESHVEDAWEGFLNG